MYIYILAHNYPTDDGGLEIIAVYSNKEKAETKFKNLKSKDSYHSQYLHIFRYKAIE